MICTKFARKLDEVPINCKAFSPVSCGNCEGGSQTQLNREINEMVRKRNNGQSIFRQETLA